MNSDPFKLKSYFKLIKKHIFSEGEQFRLTIYCISRYVFFNNRGQRSCLYFVNCCCSNEWRKYKKMHCWSHAQNLFPLTAPNAFLSHSVANTKPMVVRTLRRRRAPRGDTRKCHLNPNGLKWYVYDEPLLMFYLCLMLQSTWRWCL